MARRTGAQRPGSATASLLGAVLAVVVLGLAGCSQPAPPAASPTSSTSVPPTTLQTTPSTLPTGTLANGAPAMGPGKAGLSGTVQDPAGVVAGATVEVERLVGGSMARATLTSAADGSWQLPGVLGGRYLVRAWLAPTLGQTTPSSFFLDDGEHRDVILNLTTFSTPLVQSDIAPGVPIVSEPAQVVVQVDSTQVQADGTVASEPDVGLLVQLVSGGAWTISSPNPTVTDSLGQATWTATCSTTGIHALKVDLGAPAPSTYSTPSTAPSSTTSSSTTTTTTTLAPAPTVAPQLVPINTPFCSVAPQPTFPTFPTTTAPSQLPTTTTTNPTGQTPPTFAGVGG
ncbi:MAG: carboxypeptidase-like regulatory domain-containing protein [Acidimicrobiales bacterium]